MRPQMQPATAENRAVAHHAAKPTLQCRVHPRRRRYFATSREQVSASGSHSVNEKPTPAKVLMWITASVFVMLLASISFA